MKSHKVIVIIGSSATGKTSLVNEFRKQKNEYIVPMRYITRPSRQNDDLGENNHVSAQEFDTLVKNGKINIYWSRQLVHGIERYGFETVHNTGKTVVYSGNNAMLRDEALIAPANFKQNCLAVLLTCSYSIRLERITRRSPDMSTAERDMRLNDDGLDLVEKVHILLSSDNATPNELFNQLHLELSRIKNERP